MRVRGTSGGGDGPWEQVKGTPRRSLSFVGSTEVAVEGENEAEEIYVELSEAAAVATTVNTALTDFVEEGEEEVRLDLSAPDGAPYVLGDSSQMEVVVLNAAAPGAPENLAVAPGDGKLELSWTPVPGDPEGYDVQYRQLGASSWTDAGHTGTDPSQAITGLTNQRGYEVRVRWNHSPQSATGDWATGSGIPTVQTLTLSVNRQLAEGGENVTLTATLGQAAVEARTIWITASGTATGGTSSIDVDWSASPSQLADGELQIPLMIAQGSTSATATLTVVDDEDVDAGEIVVLEARTDGAVVGHTTPRNVDLITPLVSNRLTLTIEDNEEGPPGPTTALTVTAGDGKLDLSWTAPSDNGGSVVSGYHVHYTSAAAGTVADDRAVQSGASPSPANGWVAVNRSGTTASQEITGLSNDTEYRVRVRARNSNGDGAWTHGKGTPLAGAQPPAPTGTTVWSATLTVKDILAGLGINFGCSDVDAASVECSLTSVLTDDQFTYDGVTYDVDAIENSPETGEVQFKLNKVIPSGFASFALEVNGNSVGSLSVSTTTGQMSWENTGLSWSEGDTVSLRLVEGPPGPPSAPTVMLSASPNPVAEGRPVTVTASLSEALSSSVTIPVTISTSSPNTAEPEDVGTLTAITIASGATSGTETITTEQDTDTDDETFTVLLDTANLPSEVTAGSPSSVEIRISDDDRSGGGGEGGGEGGGGGGSAPDLTVVPPLVVSIRGGEAITEGGEARFSLSATPAPATGTSLSVSMSISDSGDFATSGETGTRTVLIDESGTASFTVSTEDDAVYEEDGAITATLGTGNGYTPHASSNSALVTVRDNDLPVVTIEAVGEAVTEGGAARFTVRATPAPAPGTSLSVRVRVSDSGGFAASGQTGARTVRIDDSGSAVLSVSQDDALHEQDGILTAVVEVGSGYIPHASSNSAAVTVRDNDLAPPTAEQRAWLLRFGRTVSQQVVDALQQRFSSSAQPGLELTLAGESLTSATPLEENHVLLSRLLGFEKVSSQELAQGSSFNFSGDGAGPRLSFWGSGALSSFNGSEDTFNLRGDVTTALLGAEWSSERWRAGAALSHSRGSGSFQGGRGAGEISGALTGLFPYGRYALTPRLGIWATAGYGWGSLSHNPDGYALEYNPVATMSMGALGMEGLLLEGGSDGVTLTTTADLLLLKTSSQEVEGLPASDGNLSRFRLGLEATRPFLLSNGSSLSPSLELGIRQDRGDAETGFGMDLGAAVTWSAPERGVSAVVKGRTLLSHGAEHFQEKGLALSFSWQPTPSERGVSLSLSHAVGGAAEGGTASLLNPTAIEVLDATSSDGERFEARLAYGFPFYNDRLTITPSVAAALSPGSRSYSLLWSVAPYAEQLHGEEPWELSIEGERQEHSSSSSPVDHSLKLLFSLPF